MEHDPSEKTVQERKPKRKQKKASKNDREADDPTLPQLVSLTKEQQECLEAFKKRAEELSRQYDADLRTWAAGKPQLRTIMLISISSNLIRVFTRSHAFRFEQTLFAFCVTCEPVISTSRNQKRCWPSL
eukprot:TRINITY_DN1671_c0_g1_i4.p1 TRINITY_DN1671_c0_g1~~TRINITY_DN1671_c0_g1_i4.p1  ORF type:complete len:129 (-),score=24.60 TRINITY_DN1671_c0_g1_i4:871-1257(-)